MQAAASKMRDSNSFRVSTFIFVSFSLHPSTQTKDLIELVLKSLVASNSSGLETIQK
jgi:hypothetical protein